MKKQDPRLFEIADWLNKATADELVWIRIIRQWYYKNFLDELRKLGIGQRLFLDFCKDVCRTGNTTELFNSFTSVPEELSEDEKREIREGLKGWIDPGTGKPPYFEPPEPVVPFLAERGVLHNLPTLSERSRKKIAKILPVFVELWEERIRGKSERQLWEERIPEESKRLFWEEPTPEKPEKSKRPLLRQCPVCDTYFVPSRKSQRFCQTPASDRPVNSRTGKPSPPCRIVAYQRTEEYKKRTAAKMAKWRKNKDKKQVVEVRPAEPVQKPRRRRSSKSSK